MLRKSTDRNCCFRDGQRQIGQTSVNILLHDTDTQTFRCIPCSIIRNEFQLTTRFITALCDM